MKLNYSGYLSSSSAALLMLLLQCPTTRKILFREKIGQMDKIEVLRRHSQGVYYQIVGITLNQFCNVGF